MMVSVARVECCCIQGCWMKMCCIIEFEALSAWFVPSLWSSTRCENCLKAIQQSDLAPLLQGNCIKSGTEGSLVNGVIFIEKVGVKKSWIWKGIWNKIMHAIGWQKLQQCHITFVCKVSEWKSQFIKCLNRFNLTLDISLYIFQKSRTFDKQCIACPCNWSMFFYHWHKECDIIWHCFMLYQRGQSMWMLLFIMMYMYCG